MDETPPTGVPVVLPGAGAPAPGGPKPAGPLPGGSEPVGRESAGPEPVLPVPAGPEAAGTTGDDGPPRLPHRPRRARPTARQQRRRRVVAGVLAAGLVVLVILVVAGYLWYHHEANPGPEGPAVVVSVHEGDSMGTVTRTLADEHVIGSSLAFRIYLLFHGSPTVQPGEYLLHRSQGFGAVKAHLASGPDVFDITVRPGFTVAEVARAVGDLPGRSATAFARAAAATHSPWQPPGSTNLDGLLGVGTYRILPDQSDAAVLAAMVARFDHGAAAADLTGGAAALGMTPYQVITVASIVQKEAISPGDSTVATAYNVGRVARVIYNRLATGTALQDNSTVFYAEGRDGGAFTDADLHYDSPYNTYEHAGLPPTPICFPSLQALQAALHPPAGAWRYFVLTSPDGTETFSVTYAEQQAAEALAASRGL